MSLFLPNERLIKGQRAALRAQLHCYPPGGSSRRSRFDYYRRCPRTEGLWTGLSGARLVEGAAMWK